MTYYLNQGGFEDPEFKSRTFLGRADLIRDNPKKEIGRLYLLA